jgi:hypothetical protein
VALGAVLVAGCGKGGDATEAVKSPAPKAEAPLAEKETSPNAATTDSAPASNAVKSPGASTPAATTDASGGLPENLRSPAYLWYGLGYQYPIDLVLEVPAQHETFKGTMSIQPNGVVDGAARFVVHRGGDLAKLFGDEELELRPDGIYVTANTKGKLSDPTLDLPADPKAGYTWRIKSSLSTDQEKIKQNLTCKVIGKRPFTEAGKKRMALVVRTKGYVSINGELSPTTATYWYLKEVGLVRTELEVTPKGRPRVKMVMHRAPKETPQG